MVFLLRWRRVSSGGRDVLTTLMLEANGGDFRSDPEALHPEWSRNETPFNLMLGARILSLADRDGVQSRSAFWVLATAVG